MSIIEPQPCAPSGGSGTFTGVHNDIAGRSAASAHPQSSITGLVADLAAMQLLLDALDSAVVLKGTWNASVGTFPGSGTAQAGYSYIVSVAGTVGGIAFSVGDRVIAIVDNASTTVYANNWFKADYTDQVISVVGQTGVVTNAQILTALLTVDGAGSGLDADLLDGLSSASFQAADADLTALAAANNSTVLAATTASFLAADETKLDGIEAGATADQTAAEILAKVLTVDGAGSGLDADTLDGLSSAAFQTADSDLTALAAANNSTVLAAVTAAFLSADRTKLDGVEAGATNDQTAAEILAKILTVDGAGSGLDADLLDGTSSAGFQPTDPDLTAIAALVSAADKLPYATGVNTWALTDLTAAGRALLDDANAAAQLTTLGVSQVSPGRRWTPDFTTTPGTMYGDVTLSGGISGGDTLTGGTAASDSLTLASTVNATRGVINFRDRTYLITEDKIYSAQTIPIALIDITSSRTLTMSSATGSANGIRAISFAPIIVQSAASGTSTHYIFEDASTIKTDTTNRTFSAIASFRSTRTITADTGTFTVTSVFGVSLSPSFGVVSAGTLTVTAYSGYSSAATIGASTTITALSHFQAVDITNTGTVTTQTAVLIPILAGATTNIGLSNNSTTVYPPGTTTITAVTDAIRIDRTHVRLNNTSGSSKTLTSAPTLADGQSGQWIVITNTSAQNVVLQDQGTLASSNLRLGATTRTLGQNDSIILKYDGTTGDWLELQFSNVL